MYKRTARSTVIILFLIAAFLAQPGAAEARGGGPGPAPDPHHGGPVPQHYGPYHHYPSHGAYVRALPRDVFRFFLRGLEYCYWNGIFYRPMRGYYVVAPAPVGAMVQVIPAGYAPVVVEGTEYYTVNEVTYAKADSGYQVVPEPKVVVIKDSELKADAKAQLAAEQAAEKAVQVQAVTQQSTVATTGASGSFIVNIPNASGSYTAVAIKKSGSGFTGPQGEYYAAFPSVEQLKVMYGK